MEGIWQEEAGGIRSVRFTQLTVSLKAFEKTNQPTYTRSTRTLSLHGGQAGPEF